MTIYFIGGLSASGKSTIAKKLAEKHKFTHTNLDNYFDIALNDFPERDSVNLFMKQISLALITILSSTNQNHVVEGCWLEPSDIKNLSKQYSVLGVFLVYGTINTLNFISEINKTGLHWLCKESDEYINNYLLSTSSLLSSRLKQECEINNIQYIDVSAGFCTVEKIEAVFCS